MVERSALWMNVKFSTGEYVEVNKLFIKTKHILIFT